MLTLNRWSAFTLHEKYQLRSMMTFGKSHCGHYKTSTETADNAGGICRFTYQLQSVLISKVKTRPVINPNALQ